MKNITEHIRQRRSVRNFDGRTLDEITKEKLLKFTEKIENPFDIPVTFKLMEAKEHGLNCPVVNGTDLYIGGKIKCMPNANVAFGYSFEMLVLYAQALGIGTVWLGGTMNRAAYEQAMELEEDEMMPCATPVGYTAKKMSLREIMMRKAIKADERLPFEDLFFDGSFDTPLTKEKAGKFAEPLEMVRLAPSAVNKQPWRVVAADNSVHFYLKRSLGSSHEEKPDMQKVDLGIALCHFALAAKENNLSIEFAQKDPKLAATPEFEYIASYVLK
ncbi:MAG: nitroreductase [Ruminococcaceae bacterium]|nr:nitroreductase [Oscillospiraceae bacterium]